MKKLITMVACLVMIFPLTACGSRNCTHSYYPVNETGQWVYVTSASGQTVSSTVTRTEITPEGFTNVLETTGASVNGQWICEDGALINLSYNQMSSAQTTQTEITDHYGVTLPVEENWTAGYTWEHGYTISGQTSVNGTTMEISGDISVSSQIIGEEQVDVPAGSFTAMRVDSTMSSSLTLLAEGTSIPVVFVQNQTDYYVLNVGLVKTISTSELGQFTVELESYSP